MAKPTQILNIDPPNELCFQGPFTDVITTTLSLSNPSEKQVCFKVKTTAPKQYCVRPNSGIVPPKGSVKVAVMLQPFEYNNEEKNKHKFMVQTAFVPEGETSLDNIWKNLGGGDLMDSKLKVVMKMPTGSGDSAGNNHPNLTTTSPPTAPNPTTPIKTATVSGTAATPGGYTEAEFRKVVDDKKRTEASLAHSEQEVLKLKARLEQLEASPGRGGSSGVGVVSSGTGFQLLHLLIAIVLAVVGGLLLGKMF